jgi:amino acid transporter
VSILTNTTSTLHNPTWYAFALAGLLGAFTLVGFELAADMSEDAVNPIRSVPRGVTWAVAGSCGTSAPSSGGCGGERPASSPSTT